MRMFSAATRGTLRHAHTRAFTLLELLVCIGIIAILIGLILPAMSGARKTGVDVACLARLRDLSVCTVVYTDSYKCLPVSDTLHAVPMLQLPLAEWYCGADLQRVDQKRDSSYAYMGSLYMGPHPDLSQPATLQPWAALPLYERNPTLPLYRDIFAWHGHRNVAYWNGAVERWID